MKKHIYQIDQSGKVEQTNKNTVLACVNSEKFTILISARIKRQIQENFRRRGLINIFVYHLFATGLFFLIKNLKNKSEIVIDKEYPGKDKLIGDILTKLLSLNKKPAHNISFARIGNTPKVHYAAHDVFVKRTKPDKVLSYNEVVLTLKKTDGRLRGCFATLVDARPRSVKTIYQNNLKKSRA